MRSLWNVDDQTARLDELTSHQVEVKEAPLRRDVRSLGRLLGEVLKEQGGDELYAAVNDPGNEGSQVVIAPGTYVLSGNYPNGGRLELQAGMGLQGQPGQADGHGLALGMAA